jgi:hypothetical protein
MDNQHVPDYAQQTLRQLANSNEVLAYNLYSNYAAKESLKEQLLGVQKRLLKLKGFAMALPEDRVNLGNWRENKTEHKRRLASPEDKAYTRSVYDVTDEELKTDCGTVACILGWVASDPHYKQEGWSAEVASEGYGVWILHKSPVNLTERDGYAAAGAYFGLDHLAAAKLFCPTLSTDLSELATFLQRLEIVLDHVNKRIQEVEA